MKLLVARHGNTFETGETPHIIGSLEDMPLTAEGEAQAARLAAFMKNNDYIPCTIACGGLRRTRRTADIIAMSLGVSAASTDSRLTELDYGAWSGLTTEQVRQRFGTEEVDNWDHRGTMPINRGWSPNEADLIEHILNFASNLDGDCPGQLTLAVTSNGVLRFFAKLVDGLFEELADKRALKVGTGNICGFERDGSGWRLLFWNQKP